MKRSILLLLAISSLLAGTTSVGASSRPRYGGNARVLLHGPILAFDPLQESENPAERDRLVPLIFDTLTEIDAQGHVRPRLANAWQAGADQRTWQFRLRVASFHDGSAVTAADVVASVKMSYPDWKVIANGKEAVTIETPAPMPRLPEMLALPRFAIVKRLDDGTLVGSGPYRVSEWQPNTRALLESAEDYWAGRPYPDKIEIVMGASLRDHLLERSLGRDSLAELSVDQLRTLEQTSQNVSVSRPSDLLVLMFTAKDSPSSAGGRKPVDVKVREALSWAINRPAISGVLLMKHAAPANGLLPQWMTGAEFLLGTGMDTDRARKLRSEVGAAPTIALAYDFADPAAKMVAERIAVDAREVGITVQPYGDAHVNSKSGRQKLSADAVLLRLPLQSVEPSVALASLADDLGFAPEIAPSVLSQVAPEGLVDLERKVMENFRLIPVVHVSQAVWLNSNVHNWQQLPNGEWKLEQLWVEGPK